MKDSKTTTIGGINYCAYCAIEAKEDIMWDEYTESRSYYCDCEAAKLDVKGNTLLCQAKALTNTKAISNLHYKAELEDLKYKYR